MFEHIILFRADDLAPEVEAELMLQLGSLSSLPGIVEFALGKNISNRSRGFDYCMRITFTDQAAHDAYQADQRHLDVVKYNRSVTAEHICVDFLWEPHLEAHAGAKEGGHAARRA